MKSSISRSGPTWWLEMKFVTRRPDSCSTAATKRSPIAVWKALLEKGVYLNLALPPATPDARPLLRSSISAAHTEAQLDRVIAAFAEVSEEFGLVNEPLQRATA